MIGQVVIACCNSLLIISLCGQGRRLSYHHPQQGEIAMYVQVVSIFQQPFFFWNRTGSHDAVTMFRFRGFYRGGQSSGYFEARMIVTVTDQVTFGDFKTGGESSAGHRGSSHLLLLPVNYPHSPTPANIVALPACHPGVCWFCHWTPECVGCISPTRHHAEAMDRVFGGFGRAAGIRCGTECRPPLCRLLTTFPEPRQETLASPHTFPTF